MLCSTMPMFDNISYAERNSLSTELFEADWEQQRNLNVVNLSMMHSGIPQNAVMGNRNYLSFVD